MVQFMDSMLSIAESDKMRLLPQFRQTAVDEYRLKHNGRHPRMVNGEPQFRLPKDLDCLHAALAKFIVPPSE